MLLAFSLIFVGIKNFRDRHSDGIISFGKAFRIGFFICLIASTFYVVTWMIYSHYYPGYMEQYTAHTLEKMRAAGATQAAIDKEAADMASFTNMYNNNPFFKALLTYLEVLPVGLLVSLVAALILKRKNTPVQMQTAS